eukprot:CAMPEP_0183727534 /NCGR_PEP_ID=MMETSP0737-20130205/25806_1 /TAXON_ID=385413 /ORGANISM="Thalassiosira miniscula, Strain CCMP1093" /LENGTH=263 /DNA_ID=CAMNT_0025959197 /DNA_START=33 /DNA_END=824 /DNA_ORIENTATION=-
MTPKIKLMLALLLAGGQAVTSFTVQPPRFVPSFGTGKNKKFPLKPHSTISTSISPSPIRRPSPTALEAIPGWFLYSLGHVIGGNTNVPVVIKARKWYNNRIPLPSWTPPSFVFGPVWTMLYSLMGVSVWRVAKSGSTMTNLATKLWTFHYALNVIWAPIFFGFQNLRLALIINTMLIASLGYILPIFYRIDALSAYLQVPYLMWLIFATILNQAICKLNPTVGGVNEARIQADLAASGDGYNDAMLQYDIKKLQAAAAKYAGL